MGCQSLTNKGRAQFKTEFWNYFALFLHILIVRTVWESKLYSTNGEKTLFMLIDDTDDA